MFEGTRLCVYTTFIKGMTTLSMDNIQAQHTLKERHTDFLVHTSACVN